MLLSYVYRWRHGDVTVGQTTRFRWGSFAADWPLLTRGDGGPTTTIDVTIVLGSTHGRVTGIILSTRTLPLPWGLFVATCFYRGTQKTQTDTCHTRRIAYGEALVPTVYFRATAMMGHITGGVVLGGLKVRGCRPTIKPWLVPKKNLDNCCTAMSSKACIICAILLRLAGR